MTSASKLPDALGGSTTALIAADGASVRQAINDGATDLGEVVVLGPTEDAFQDLVAFALNHGEPDLLRGAVLTDTASLTSYTLALFDADIQVHDGVTHSTRKAPILIRSSAGEALPVAWESLMNLRPWTASDPTPPGAATLPPHIQADLLVAADAALAEQVTALEAERTKWIEKVRGQLDVVGYRLEDQLADAPADVRAARMARFEHDKQDRLATLDDISRVLPTACRQVGWLHAVGGARTDELGYDPNSEKPAIAAVAGELEALGYDVDDRQSARAGYDLYARHRTTREQRLVEVKGLQGDLRAVWLEQHEWIQAQQRGDEYWLYVVDSCATSPTIRIRVSDPASVFHGPRQVQRFQIPLSELRQHVPSDQ